MDRVAALVAVPAVLFVKLPSNSIGISDILDYRECPRRFAFGMRRHNPLPAHLATHEGQKDEPPEKTNENNAYGSAIHMAIELTEQFFTDEDAVQAAFAQYHTWLEPEDLQLLRDDLAAYHARDYTGVEVVASEQDMKFPLFEHPVHGTIYFRFKIDRLYRRLDNPAVYIMVDYKSSKWRRSAQEVHNDLQQWSYNLGAHEVYPEIEHLTQIYDQLRFGPEPTTKSPAQREQIRAWLVAEVTAILDDDLLEPQHNDWCPYCPVMMSCPVIERLSDWSRDVVAALAPSEKEGRKTVVHLDEGRIEEYLALYPKAKSARDILKRYVEEIDKLAKRAPEDKRTEWGARITTRKNTKLDASHLQAMHQEMGPDFYHVATVSKSAVEDFYGKDAETPVDRILAEAPKVDGAEIVRWSRD